MSEKEIVLSQDVQDQLAKLSQLGEKLQQHMRPAMVQATSLLSGAIEPEIPTLTGWARATFGTKITGQELTLTGYVGWSGGKGSAWYMNVVEYGAKPHFMLSKGHAGHIEVGLNEWKTVHEHPGFPGRFLLSSALQENQDAVDYFFNLAADQALEEMVINP